MINKKQKLILFKTLICSHCPNLSKCPVVMSSLKFIEMIDNNDDVMLDMISEKLADEVMIIAQEIIGNNEIETKGQFFVFELNVFSKWLKENEKEEPIKAVV